MVMTNKRRERPPLRTKAIVESVQEGAPCGSCAVNGTAEGTINEYPESVDHVDAAPGILLQANPRRIGWMLVNLSDYEVYVAFSNRASSTFGFTVDSEGGALSFSDVTDPLAVCQAEVWASAEQDDCKIYLYEVVK